MIQKSLRNSRFFLIGWRPPLSLSCYLSPIKHDSDLIRLFRATSLLIGVNRATYAGVLLGEILFRGERIKTRWRIYPKHAQEKNQALAVKKGKGGRWCPYAHKK